MSQEPLLSPSRQGDTQVQTKCPSCGGGLLYEPSIKNLKCQYCGYAEQLGVDNNLISELDLKDHLQSEEWVVEDQGKRVMHCESCGANVFVDKDQFRSRCTFCASESIREEAFQHRLFKPSGIIPFYLGKKEAESSFSLWIGRGWFHPSELKHAASLEALIGIYVPFWTFDFQAYAEWCGEAGYHYTTYRQVMINGRMTSQPVTQIRWEYRSGTLRHFFDDILVPASDRIDPRYRTRISGYRLNEMVNFDPRYTIGWESELYNINLEDSYKIAEKVVLDQVRNMCSGQLGGNVQRNLNVHTELSSQTFKHVYLPLWVSSYRYNGKIYRILINGQTGKIYGEKPLSWLKIAILIFIFAAAVIAIWWLRESGIIVIH